jgi:hypothetical protein
VESFDQSLKFLLQHDPLDFLRFGLGDPAAQLLSPLPSGLPSRSRDVDGTYLIALGGHKRAAHLEFHRRHQSLEELAIDVAEAQIRLFRRERVPVLSLVWDLYGSQTEPLLSKRTFRFGAPEGEDSSLCVYQVVNLRALGWQNLLGHGPAALWPLVPLTRDGATEAVVHQACDAIERRTELSSTERADHLAVLWFVAEAEDVPTRMMRVYLQKERLMASTLYRSIIEEGEARGEVRGEARKTADTIIRVLTYRLGALDPAIRERIRTLSDIETLTSWYEEALLAVDAEGARRLAEKIQKAPLPSTAA